MSLLSKIVSQQFFLVFFLSYFLFIYFFYLQVGFSVLSCLEIGQNETILKFAHVVAQFPLLCHPVSPNRKQKETHLQNCPCAAERGRSECTSPSVICLDPSWCSCFLVQLKCCEVLLLKELVLFLFGNRSPKQLSRVSSGIKQQVPILCAADGEITMKMDVVLC